MVRPGDPSRPARTTAPPWRKPALMPAAHVAVGSVIKPFLISQADFVSSSRSGSAGAAAVPGTAEMSAGLLALGSRD